MLIEFSVGNYRSFKDTVTFSMVAAKITAQDKRLDEDNVFKVDDDLSLLRSSAIYGANASGKSNLAVNLALLFKTNIISIDSMQVYKGMDIGTDKLRTEKYKINQHMIDLFEPSHLVTVVEFRDICRSIIEKEFSL